MVNLRMNLMQKKNKGIVLTFSAVIEGLFIIGVLGFLYWFFLSRFVNIRVSIDETLTERHAINLANVLMSSEKLAYEENGKISRGILDSNKLDSVFIKKDDIAGRTTFLLQPKDIGIGYPNTLNLVTVVDMEKCQNNDCNGWMVSLSGPATLQGLSIGEFANCLSEHQNKNIDLGSYFRMIAGYELGGPFMGFLAGSWQPWDIEECVKNKIPPSIKSFFTDTPISSKGLPVLIRYSDGELHVGKIVVGVAEWI